MPYSKNIWISAEHTRHREVFDNLVGVFRFEYVGHLESSVLSTNDRSQFLVRIRVQQSGVLQGL